MHKFIICSLIFSFSQNKNKLPNIIIILADDLGWTDLSCYGSTFYETPNLDQLAANGIRFTQSYATSPVCSPTRSSIMTGKYPIKTGLTDWIKGRQENGKAKPFEKLIVQPTAYQLSLDEKTIAEFALEKGYKTFFAGKWHLGEEEKYWPEHQGFEINKGGWSKGSPIGKINDSTGGFFTPYKNPKLSDGPKGEYLTDRLTNESLDFIEENSQSPFLLFYSLYAVHNPLQAPSKVINKYKIKKEELNIKDDQRFLKDETWMNNQVEWKRRLVQDNPVYAAMIENMDFNIGRILNKIKDLHIEENTLIIFTSDNGGLSTSEGSPTTNAPLRAGKGWLYEGGIRVPMIMNWKGKIDKGIISNIPVTTVDIFPTIASTINSKYKKDKGIDGENIFHLLNKSNTKRILFWHYPHYSNQGGKPSSAILAENYKLIYNYEDDIVELYNLEEDLSETKNIISTQTSLATKMKKQLFRWLKKNAAQFPITNKNYNPLSNSNFSIE
jgi:arylsulfatase A-like enzyme